MCWRKVWLAMRLVLDISKIQWVMVGATAYAVERRASKIPSMDETRSSAQLAAHALPWTLGIICSEIEINCHTSSTANQILSLTCKITWTSLNLLQFLPFIMFHWLVVGVPFFNLIYMWKLYMNLLARKKFGWPKFWLIKVIVFIILNYKTNCNLSK